MTQLKVIQYTNGLYQIHFRYNFDSYEIDGVKCKERTIVLDSLDNIEYVKTENVHKRWIHRKEQVAISIDDYNQLETELIDKPKYHDDDNELHFKNPDDEIRYVHFLREWVREYETVTTKHKVEFDVVKTFKSENEYIHPHYTYLTSDKLFKQLDESGEFLCSYSGDQVTMFKQICAEFKIDQDDIDIGSTSGIRFAQINKSYLFSDEIRTRRFTLTNSTYNECLQRYNEDYNYIREIVERHLQKQGFLQSKDFFNDNEVVRKLDIISGCIDDIEYKVKSEHSHRIAKKYTKELMDYLYDGKKRLNGK